MDSPWEKMAESLGYKEGAKEMWREMYVTKGISVDNLARRFAVSSHTIRKQLLAAEIPLKKRGGKTWSKVTMTEDLAEEIKKEGVRYVAEKLGVDYTTIRKNYFRWLKARESKKEEAV